MDKPITKILVAIMLPALVLLAGSCHFINIGKDSFDRNNSVRINEEGSEKPNLRSFFGNAADYDAAFSNVGNVERKNILAGITSHHFLAKDLIARFYAGISDDSVENIILVGPDHYEELRKDKTDVATSGVSWDTPYGELESSSGLAGKILQANSDIKINDNIFKTEHSIYTEIPFIKKFFPKAKILPLIVRNNDDFGKFMEIGKRLNMLAGGKSIMVISSDFSHEVSVTEAQRADGLSITALNDLRVDKLDGIDCDCRACMAIMLGFISESGKYTFEKVENKNSANFGGPGGSVTSYISGYFLPL